MQPLHRNRVTYQQRPTKKPLLRQTRVRLGMTLVAVFFISIFIHKLSTDNGPNNGSGVAKAATPADTKTQPKKTEDLSTLQPALAAIIKKYPSYDTSVSVVELNSGKLVQAGDSYPYVAASTTKVLTALLYLNNVESGQVSLNKNISGTPAQDLLKQMINKSDNDAWAQLNVTLTKDSLAAYAKEHGVTSYNPIDNTIASNDMAQLLAKLYNGKLLNAEHTKLLYSWMQNTSEEDYIPPNIPTGIKLYHKAGYLNDRMHDVAIIDNGTTPYVVVIYSKSYNNADYNVNSGQKLFAEITKQTLATFK